MKTVKFYDTCSLLLDVNHLFQQDNYKLVISSITLDELEKIKSNSYKDLETKIAARKVLQKLENHPEEYEVSLFREDYIQHIQQRNFEITNDTKIIACGRAYMETLPSNVEFIYVTNDLCHKHIARLYFPNVISIQEEKYEYDGYKEVYLTESEMNYFYSNRYLNIYDLHVNQYLLVYNANTKELVDHLCWTGTEYRSLHFNTFTSTYFGDIKPLKGDPYQMLLADSLINNKITLVKGPAGTGKTLMSLGYLFHRLERGKIDKIIIFCNTVATKNSARLGFYPGSKDEKLLDSQIGNLLSSKLGGQIIVEQLMQEGQLILLPLSDIRGYDTTGMKAGIYISEAQNLDIELMKLALQRIGEDGICIIDGDYATQLDDINFSGSNNGMRRASQVFRGEDIYGEVTLKQIHRSRIASIADKL